MKKIAVAFALFAFLLALSGCVNRYEGCAAGACCNLPGKDCTLTSDACCGGTYCKATPDADDAPELGTCQYSMASYWDAWQQVALLAVLISMFLAVLAYMAGYALSNQMLLAWAKQEIFQVLVSAFLLGSLIAIIATTQTAMSSDLVSGGTFVCPPDHACHIALAKEYVNAMYDDSAKMARSIVKVNSILVFLKNFKLVPELTIAPYMGITVLQPLAGLGIIYDSLRTCLDVLIKVMMLLKVQEIIFDFIELALFPILLVMGLIFRTFFFTRKLGGLLIALAIGLYLVYPVVFILGHNMFVHTVTTDRTDPTSFVSYNVNIVSNIVVVDTSDAEAKFQSELPDGTRIDFFESILNTIGGAGETIIGYGSGQYVIGEGGFLDKTGLLLVYATFIPFAALMTTIGFVRGLSVALGGDIEIAGLTRLL
jgi:hypothetical protein